MYDDYGNVITATDALNQTVTYTYDPNTHLRIAENWPVSTNDFLYVKMVRNAQGDVTDYQLKNTETDSGYLLRSTFTYDGYGNVISMREYDTGREALTTYGYDSVYNSAFLTSAAITTKDADGIQSTSNVTATYNKLTGTIATYKDGRGNLTSYTYDKLDRITKVTHPDLSVFQAAYDDLNNQITTTNETNIKNLKTWDSIGRIVETGIFENEVYKAKTKTGYDDLSRVIWEEDPSGNRVAYTYDRWNRLIKTTNADNSFSTVVFDDINNTVTATDEESNSVLRLYDKVGRLFVEKVRENGAYVTKQTLTYDTAGNVSQVQDALNHVTQYTYDKLGRLTGVLTPKLESFSYGYDKFGNMTQITYPGNKQVNKKYDEAGRLIQHTNELGHTKKWYYDLAGNLSKLIDSKGQQFTYQYDGQNRLLERKSISETVTYTYEPDGKRKTMADNTGTTKYDYIPYTGLLTKVTFPDLKTVQYTYDTRGNLSKLTDPFGRIATYTYDTVNRMKDVKTDNVLSASYEYFNNDRLKKIQHGNGISTNYTYEGFNLKTLQHKKADGTTLNSYSYTYDPVGNIAGRTENGQTHSYTYDPLGRIKTNSQFNETYEYDPRGNRISLVSDEAPDIRTTLYEYDAWDRLTQVAAADNVNVSYKYNGDNQLYERTENGVTTRYYWSMNQIIGEATVSGTQITPKASYIYGNGLLERIDATSLSRATFLMNGHQDVVELRGSTGNVLNRYTYDIWGKPLTTTETVSNPFRYSGEYWDNSTNLQYLRSRWYDPGMGRFINEDTYEGDFKNPLTLNLYAYVHNNPLIYTDPSGNCPMCLVIPIVSPGVWAALAGTTAAVTAGVVVGNAIADSKSRNKTVDFVIPVPVTINNALKNRRPDQKITLYHATSSEAVTDIMENGIDLEAGRGNTDFGQGFYLTNDFEQAKDWVNRKYGGNGEILIFQVNKNVFKRYKGKSFSGNSKQWRQFVYNNRNSVSTHNFDYVEGPMLANPSDKKNMSKYRTTGYQVSIHNNGLASAIFKGFVGVYQMRK